jgi:hypothetical protein
MGDLLGNEALLALIGTVFGGVGLKLIEQLLGRNKRRDDLAASLRTELRTDLTGLRADNDRLERDVDEWRDKYYRLVAQMAQRGIPICVEDTQQGT